MNPVYTVEVAFDTDPLTVPSVGTAAGSITETGQYVLGEVTEYGEFVRSTTTALTSLGRFVTLLAVSAWTDVTSYVRDISIRRGRQHELGRTQAGEANIRLSNRDRRFDPTNTGSPYYPDVVPMRRLRVRATWQAVTYDLFSGYVEDWGQTWPSRPIAGIGDAEVNLRAVDGFKLLTLYEVGGTYSSEVLADGPEGYWKLDEPVGSTVFVDSSSTGLDLTVNPAADLAAMPMPLVGGQRCPRGVGSTVAVEWGQSAEGGAVFLPSADRLFEAWVYPTTVIPQYTGWLFTVHDPGNTTNWQVHRVGGGAFPTHQLVVTTFSNPPGFGNAVSESPTDFLVDDEWQHVAIHVRTTGLNAVDWYRNGAFVARSPVTSLGTHTIFTDPSGPLAVAVGCSYGSPGTNWDGGLAHVAFYGNDYPYGDPEDAIPSPERIAAHYAAGLDDFAPAPSGVVVGLLLDAMGWPATERAIDTGQSTIQELAPLGSNLELMLAVAEDTELGLLYMAGDGTVTFVERGTPPVTSGTFGDGGGVELAYADLEGAYDDQDLWSRVIVDRTGGSPVTVEDADAIARYGPRTLSRSSLLNDAGQQADMAGYLLGRYKAPAQRPRQMVLTGDDAQSQMLALELGDRVTILRRPPPSGTVSMDARIEGITHHIAPATAMETTFDLVPMFGYWLVEDPVWGLVETATVGW